MVASTPALWLRDTLSLVLLYRRFPGVQRLGEYIFLRLARCFQPQQASLAGDPGCFPPQQASLAGDPGYFPPQQASLAGDPGCFPPQQASLAGDPGCFGVFFRSLLAADPFGAAS